MAGINLTTKELDNIKISYEHYGPEKLNEWIQSIWTEAFEEGYDKAVKDKRNGN